MKKKKKSETPTVTTSKQFHLHKVTSKIQRCLNEICEGVNENLIIIMETTCRICLISGCLTVNIYDIFKNQYRLVEIIEELLAEEVY